MIFGLAAMPISLIVMYIISRWPNISLELIIIISPVLVLCGGAMVAAVQDRKSLLHYTLACTYLSFPVIVSLLFIQSNGGELAGSILLILCIGMLALIYGYGAYCKGRIEANKEWWEKARRINE